jgi:hypothetical protein
MFKYKTFTAHSFAQLYWKIECDDLTSEDIKALACIIANAFKFGSVIGIPKGGQRLAEALLPFCEEGYPLLVVDDVLTTGTSMNEYYKPGAIGVVIFARGPCPDWVNPIFTLSGVF